MAKLTDEQLDMLKKVNIALTPEMLEKISGGSFFEEKYVCSYCGKETDNLLVMFDHIKTNHMG